MKPAVEPSQDAKERANLVDDFTIEADVSEKMRGVIHEQTMGPNSSWILRREPGGRFSLVVNNKGISAGVITAPYTGINWYHVEGVVHKGIPKLSVDEIKQEPKLATGGLETEGEDGFVDAVRICSLSMPDQSTKGDENEEN